MHNIGDAANNIIAGPWAQRNEVVTEWVGEGRSSDIEVDAETGIKRVKANHIAEALMLVAPMLFHNMELAGFIVDDAIHLKETTLIIESIKSYLYKQYGLYHPLQTVADGVFIVRNAE